MFHGVYQNAMHRYERFTKISEKTLQKVNINLVIQIDGKTRDVISVKKDLEIRN